MPKNFREQLIVDHMEMAVAIAHVLSAKLNLHYLLPDDDVIGYAQQGLVEAAHRYLPGSDASFRTYSWTRIRGAIIDGVRKHSRYGYSRTADASGRADPVSAQPRADFVECPDDKWDDGRGGLHSSLDKVPDPECALNPPEKRLDAQRLRASILNAIATLPPREREITLRHYYGGENFVSISKDQGLSHDRVGRIHASSIRHLRSSLTASLEGRLSTETVQ